MYIFSNLATSLDGKIAPTGGEFFPLGTPADLKQMQVLRRKADAVITGASTLRAYRKPYFSKRPGLAPIFNVIVSTQLERLSTEWAFFKSPLIRRVLFCWDTTPAARVKKFSRVATVIGLPKPSKKSSASAAKAIVRALSKLGIENLLIEGGGSLMWDFAAANLIDEYNVTLTPRILGGRESPTLVDGLGFSGKESLSLKLSQAEIIGDEIYLTYFRKT